MDSLLSPKELRSRCSLINRFFFISLLVLIVQTGCKNESGITEISNAPEIQSTNPENNAVDIAVTTSVTATFNEEMNPSTFTDSSFFLRLDTVVVPGTVSYTDSTATFAPSGNLKFESTYTAVITTGVQNMNGDGMGSDYEWNFTTANEPEETDETPPQVVSTIPARNEDDVSINTAVIATFSEPMNSSTVNSSTFSLQQGSTPISGNVTYSKTRATFSPSSPLDFDKTYTVTITTSAEDTAGNALTEEYNWSFTTSNQPDTSPPQITATDPADGADDVSIETEIRVTFNEPVEASNPDEAFDLMQDGSPVSGSVDISGNTITFTPSSDLDYESSYRATITTAIEDVAGNALEKDFSWNFTTEEAPDNTPPRITGTDPDDGAENVSIGTDITATFSEPLNSSTITDQTFFVELEGSRITGSLNPSGSTVVFTPSNDLEYESSYTVTATSGIEDAAGNSLDDVDWTFTTEDEPDNTPPQVNGTDPDDGAENVPIGTDITATFSEPLNPSTITDQTFFVELEGSRITGSLNLSSNTVAFTPSSDLEYESSYTVTATSGIEDAAGNPLDEMNWTFTTEENPDNTPPEVNSTNPVDGETNVSVNIDEITVTFNESMNSESFNENTFTVTLDGDEVDGEIPDFEGATVRFIPDDDLEYDTIYTVNISPEVEDLAGNNFGEDFELIFRTETDSDDNNNDD